jgi:3-methyladenine DNA glycosylase AlkC
MAKGSIEPYKNLISPELVHCLGHHLTRAHRGFDAHTFSADVLPRLDALEMKARAAHIADALHRHLPKDAAQRAAVLKAILHPDALDHANQPSDAEGICGWGIWPLTMVVSQHGLEDFDRSMALLREMTMRFSSEFGVRSFLHADQSRALSIMASWVDDPNRHVRRLVSEGTRPRLPWGMRLKSLVLDPSPILPLLERLRDDPEEYVRRSVANNLNDIAKDHPEVVTGLVARWAEGGKKERSRLVRHALRSLIKAGDAAALRVIGQGVAQVQRGPLTLNREVVLMGEHLGFEIELHSTAEAPQSITVDYIVHFLKANGTLSPKVFKGSTINLPARGSAIFRRSHRFTEITTRKHYPGSHALSVRINGEDTQPVAFVLRAS